MISGTDSSVARERDLYRQLLEIGAHESPQPFVEAALALVINLSGARRGIVELRGRGRNDEGDQLAVAANMGDCEDHAFSRSVIAEAFATGDAIVTSALVDPRFQDQGSVLNHRLDAVLCVPIGRAPILGVVYLQDRADGKHFTAQDQRWVELFARHLSVAADRLVLRAQEASDKDATLEVRRRIKADAIVGRSEAIAAILKRVAIVAPMDITVLLTGPSGAGKTAIARTVHTNSSRSGAPFVEVNCGLLNEHLVGNELFGSAKGSHSTADKDRGGKVQAAQGGTLFLDEIGDLPMAAQVSLLQLLSDRTFFPVGSPQVQHADVRVIAATNQDLPAAVAAKRFREDLYYRLNVFPIRVPAISERREDLPLIAHHLCQRVCARNGLPIIELSAGALSAIENCDWQGNVRELENCIEAGLIIAASDESRFIERAHLFPSAERGLVGRGESKRYAKAMRDFQRQLVVATLTDCDWKVKNAAESLGITRAHLYNLVHTLQISRPDGNPGA